VDGVVVHVQKGLFAARMAEAVLVLAAGFGLTLSVAVHSGAEPFHAETLTVALIAATLVGATWFYAHRIAAHAIARDLDLHLRHQGGLVTAWELEARGDMGPFALLTVRRVLRKLRPGDAMRALLPPIWLPLAAPLLAAVLVSEVLEDSREAPPPPRLQGLATGLVEGVEALQREYSLAVEEGRAGSADTGDVTLGREVAGLVSAARDLDRKAGEPGVAASEVKERAQALDRTLSSLIQRLAADPVLRTALREARVHSSAVGDALGNGASSGADTTSMATLDGSGAGDEYGESATGSDIMVDSTPPRKGQERADAKERGTVSGPWWSPAYDGVVEHWVEARRKALLREEQ